MITVSHLTLGVGSGATANTASVSPAANNLVLLSIRSQTGSGTPNEPTVTGDGYTWVKVNTQPVTGARLTVFRGLVSAPSAGALAIDFAGQSQTISEWSVDEFAGVVTSGTNGSGAIIQSNIKTQTGTNTGLSMTLNPFAQQPNAAFGAIWASGAALVTKGANFTEITNDTKFEVQWANNPQTTVNWTWGSVSGTDIAVALEIAAKPRSGFFAFF